jgi:tetratricopeptide (TPR) repeat protein
MMTDLGFGETNSVVVQLDSFVAQAGAGWRPYLIDLRGAVKGIEGRRAAALDDFRAAAAGALAIDDSAGAALEHLSAAAIEVSLGNQAYGVNLLKQQLDDPAWQGQVMNLMYYAIAVHTLADGGAIAEAKGLLTRARAAWPEASKRGLSADWIEMADAQIILDEGRPADALQTFRDASVAMDGKQSDAYAWATFGMAQSFDALRQSDSTIAALERYLAYPRYLRNFFSADPLFLAAVEKRLGELYDAKGDRAKALQHYSAFVDQWKDADPDLQKSVTTVKQRIAELQQQEGT